MVTSSQCQSVSAALEKCTSVRLTVLHRRNSFGASITTCSREILSVYQIPALPMSKIVPFFMVTLFAYHRGYFHLKFVPVRVMFLLCFKGDSPSSNVEFTKLAFCAIKAALSPVKVCCEISVSAIRLTSFSFIGIKNSCSSC